MHQISYPTQVEHRTQYYRQETKRQVKSSTQGDNHMDQLYNHMDYGPDQMWLGRGSKIVYRLHCVTLTASTASETC